MGKSKHKVHKSHLGPEEKKMGRQHIYILVGMVIVGILIGIYRVNQ